MLRRLAPLALLVTLGLAACGSAAGPPSADVRFCHQAQTALFYDQSTVAHLRGPLEADAGAYLFDPSSANKARLAADCKVILAQ